METVRSLDERMSRGEVYPTYACVCVRLCVSVCVFFGGSGTVDDSRVVCEARRGCMGSERPTTMLRFTLSIELSKTGEQKRKVSSLFTEPSG